MALRFLEADGLGLPQDERAFPLLLLLLLFLLKGGVVVLPVAAERGLPALLLLPLLCLRHPLLLRVPHGRLLFAVSVLRLFLRELAARTRRVDLRGQARQHALRVESGRPAHWQRHPPLARLCLCGRALDYFRIRTNAPSPHDCASGGGRRQVRRRLVSQRVVNVIH